MEMSAFLAHAVKLEAEAARMSERLAQVLKTRGDHRDAEAFYEEMAQHSRRHLKEAMTRAGYSDLDDLPKDGYRWPEGFPPETSQWRSVEDITDLDRAMQLSLEAERRGYLFYKQVAETARDPEVRVLAATFTAEERGHVEALERIMGLRPY